MEIEWVRGKLAQRRTGRWVGPSKEELARPAPKYKAACGDVQHPAPGPAAAQPVAAGMTKGQAGNEDLPGRWQKHDVFLGKQTEKRIRLKLPPMNKGQPYLSSIRRRKQRCCTISLIY